MSTERIPQKSPVARWLWLTVKWTLFALVLAFVGRQGWHVWQQVRGKPLYFQPGWFVAAVGVSILAWIPSVWYWRKLMVSLGDHVSWRHTARAYYCGHLGKYVPGKAMVFIVRMALVRGQGARPAVAGFTVGYESLAYMASGAVAAAMLAPWILHGPRSPHWAKFLDHPALQFGVPVVVFLGALLGLAVLSKVFTRLVRFTMPKSATPGTLPRLSRRDCLIGVIPLLVAWWMHGLSLGLTIQSLSPQWVSLSDWPLWTAATSVAMVAGFAAIFAPGGLGVREALFIDVLTPHLGEQQAVLAAVLMRCVCFVAEVLASGLLFAVVKPSPTRVDSTSDQNSTDLPGEPAGMAGPPTGQLQA